MFYFRASKRVENREYIHLVQIVLLTFKKFFLFRFSFMQFFYLRWKVG